MKKLLAIALLSMGFGSAMQAQTQTLAKKLELAVKEFTQAPQMEHASLGLHIINNKTGAVVYSYNGNTGLQPASSQKIVTAATALELLGTDFRYTTRIGYDGAVANGVLNGNLYIQGEGDPTLGSWRYGYAGRPEVLQKILNVLRRNGIYKIEGNIILDGSKFSYQPIPTGWEWEDIGNYYGAGCWGINWFENQYVLTVQPGSKPGEPAQIIRTSPRVDSVQFLSLLTTGAANNKEDAYIYLPPYSNQAFVEGTVPAKKSSVRIEGAAPDPFRLLAADLKDSMETAGIALSGVFKSSLQYQREQQLVPRCNRYIDSIVSPALDSIVYFFLQESINMYGETLVKTLASQQGKMGVTEDGVDIIRQYWAKKDIDRSALKMVDGSGLSMQNHVTPRSLTQVLLYARSRTWFNSFYKGLPVYNGMKMKSGTITGVKAFAGYHTAKDGNSYSFSIIVNNYEGSSSVIVQKMYKVLDCLK